MSREILFKAKRKDWRKLPKEEWWVEGYLFDNDIPTDKHYFIGYLTIEPYKGAADDDWDITGTYFYEIDPETLCQYTGLTDRNGKRIWENDVLLQKTTECFKKHNPMEWERYGVVEFGENDWNPDWAGFCSVGFYIRHIKSISIKPENYGVGHIQEGINQEDVLNPNYPMEVIENIFDNPELLEEKH